MFVKKCVWTRLFWVLFASAMVSPLGITQNQRPNLAQPVVTDSELHRAARSGDVQLLQAQLKLGANPNARNQEGHTPLLEAISAGKLDAARMLLANGANVNGTSSSGKSALIEAAELGNNEAAQLLIKAGADLNLRSRGSGTPLEAAERSGHPELAALLRKSGAHTFGRSVGDTVCVRPWNGEGYCGTVEAIDKNNYQIRVTQIIGCAGGCAPKPECSAGKRVGSSNGLGVGDLITTVSWCVTHTGVQP